MRIVIRTAAPDDAEAIARCLGELGYGTTGTVVAGNLHSLSASSRDAVFVADHKESADIVGVVSVHLLPLLHMAGFLARITALAVRASAQGRGVGRELVARAERFAVAASCRRIEVTSGDHRPAAHRFYEGLGYQADERRFIKRLAAE